MRKFKEPARIAHFYTGGPSAKERRPDVAEQIQADILALSQICCVISVQPPHFRLSPRNSFAISLPYPSLHRFNTRLPCYCLPCHIPLYTASTPGFHSMRRNHVRAVHPQRRRQSQTPGWRLTPLFLFNITECSNVLLFIIKQSKHVGLYYRGGGYTHGCNAIDSSF